MTKKSDFQPLQVYLKHVYEQLHVADAVDGVEVIDAYKKTVGDILTKLTKDIRYDNHKLYVTLFSAALRSELFYKRQALIDKVNEIIGRPVLKEIVFR
ncbi:MAG: DUF721 domain-containing protein [Bacteroidales bacterium]|nr:DUF721 domain-containing protein [Bacteroidales bacterium]